VKNRDQLNKNEAAAWSTGDCAGP